MAVTIIEALENAKYNIENIRSNIKLRPILDLQFLIALGQLSNGIGLLEKGYDPYDEVEPLLEKYGDVGKVPEKQ